MCCILHATSTQHTVTCRAPRLRTWGAAGTAPELLAELRRCAGSWRARSWRRAAQGICEE
eukprot:4461969-Lingulodinium_polyedra.AAC.1